MEYDSMALQQLATNAELNHWPPHLGVTTDSEKIEYLAQRLREVADDTARADAAEDEVATLKEANDLLNNTVEDLESKMGRIRELTL